MAILTGGFKVPQEIEIICEKVYEGERISKEEGQILYETKDLQILGKLASHIQNKYNGQKIYYVLNGHINYSNICELSCSFCSFGAKESQKKAYVMSEAQIKARFLEYDRFGIKELHIVGGLNKNLGFDYYLNMLSTIHNINPDVVIKAFTAVELSYFSKRYEMSIEEVLEQLKGAGLRMIPGGGAEIFAQEVRKEICDDKITGAEWLEVHKTAHKLGIRSNATMLFGHIESKEDRLSHMEELRLLQEKTGGFMSFIPLTYHPENNALRGKRTSAIDELKTIAISRIFLDNFRHIKSYWITLGLKVGQLGLSYGADDFDGTVLSEKIMHAAGAGSPMIMQKEEIISLIKDVGKEAVERDAYYNIVNN